MHFYFLCEKIIHIINEINLSSSRKEDSIMDKDKLSLELDNPAKQAGQNTKQNTLQYLMQINSEIPAYIAKFYKMNPHALDILLFLVNHMDGTNAVICSQVLLMDFFGLSRSTVVKCIQDLKEHGLICIAKTGSSNVYYLNDDLNWTSYDTNHKHCKFLANVILSYSEQEKTNYQKTAITASDVPPIL